MRKLDYPMSNLSITTDYVQSIGDPLPYLRAIGESGFSFIHWCHQWNTDYVYSTDEIKQIKTWFHDFDLRLNDLHSTEGIEKYWISAEKERRNAGIELIKNRIDMAAQLGSNVIIQHVQAEPTGEKERQRFWDQLRRSLDQLEFYAKKIEVRIAFENLTDNISILIKVLNSYSPEVIGLCFDTGHANIAQGSIEKLIDYKDRLISIHLHDNNGISDQHKIPFTGTIDWDKVTKFIAEATYDKCVNLEVVIHETGLNNEKHFLEIAKSSGDKLSHMIKIHRDSKSEIIAS